MSCHRLEMGVAHLVAAMCARKKSLKLLELPTPQVEQRQNNTED